MSWIYLVVAGLLVSIIASSSPEHVRRVRLPRGPSEEVLSSRFDPRKLVLVVALASACAALVHVFFFTH